MNPDLLFMKVSIRFILSFIFLLASLLLSAQNEGGAIQSLFKIQGKVKDAESRETLIGVNIYLKDTQYGTTTDSKGIYILSAPAGDYILVFSFIGYHPEEITIKLDKDLTIDVSLTPSTTAIEEVKITAQHKFFGNMELILLIFRTTGITLRLNKLLFTDNRDFALTQHQYLHRWQIAV